MKSKLGLDLLNEDHQKMVFRVVMIAVKFFLSGVLIGVTMGFLLWN